MKLLILRVFIPSDDGNSEEYEYGVIPLTGKLVRNILTKSKLMKRDKAIIRISFKEERLKFFPIDVVALTDDEMDDYMNNDYVVIERPAPLDPELALKMSLVVMSLYTKNVAWEADPEREDISVETSHINFVDLKELL